MLLRKNLIHFIKLPKVLYDCHLIFAQNFGAKIKRIVDVAGGQGILCRILKKKYNYFAEVIDLRGYTLVGVPFRKETYAAEMADYYDLIY